MKCAFADGTPVVLKPPQVPNGHHIFLSHVWKHGQDQSATIKSMLRSRVPSCASFLDADFGQADIFELRLEDFLALDLVEERSWVQ